MKHIITLFLCLFMLAIAHSQDSTNLELEIWEVEILNKNGFNIIEIDIFNSGTEYPYPVIQVMHDESIIVNVEQKKEMLVLQPSSIRKFELPIEIPSNFKGKKIKLEVRIANGTHSMKEKFKVKLPD